MTKNIHKTSMLHAPVVPTFFRYCIPWTLSLLFVSSAGIIDGMFIGRYEGPLALAALNIVWPFFAVFMGVGIMLASGGAVRYAHYLGLGNQAEARAVYTKIMLSITGLSLLVLALCLLYTEELVRLLGADDTIFPFAITYIQVMLFFLPVLLIGIGLAYFIRADEQPNLSSFGFILTAVTNVALDFVFIAQWELGILGAALATGCGYVSMVLVYAVCLFSKKQPRRLYFTTSLGKWKDVFLAAWNGISEMINEASTGTVIIFINLTVMHYSGPYGVAAFTVVSYFNWFCLMLAFGLSDSLAPLISANNACRLHRRTHSLLMVALVTAFGLGLICFAVVTFFPQQLIKLFIPMEGETTKLATTFLEIARFMYLFCGINIVLTAYFTGLLQSMASAIVAVLRSLILPIALIFCLSQFLGYEGVALALPLAELVTLGVALLLLYLVHPSRRPRRSSKKA